MTVPEKIFEGRGDFKIKKLNLECYVEEFRSVFEISNEKIKYCDLEKCKIPTEEGKKVFKRGQLVFTVVD